MPKSRECGCARCAASYARPERLTLRPPSDPTPPRPRAAPDWHLKLVPASGTLRRTLAAVGWSPTVGLTLRAYAALAVALPAVATAGAAASALAVSIHAPGTCGEEGLGPD